MKIVHLATTDFGGAYKAVERINECLNQYGDKSSVLVRSKFYNTNVTEIVNTPLKKIISKGKNFINLLLSHGEIITDRFGADLSKNRKVKEADVIILHWVNSFLSEDSIRKLAKLNKPLIWVMHDMWVFTGGCHYDVYCGKYEEQCGFCPFLKSKKEKDISYHNLQKKEAFYSDVAMTFVAISRWEKECALKSTPLRNQTVTWIPNPINMDTFHPMNIVQLRLKYGIPKKKIILFGADKALENKTKGFQYLVRALENVDGQEYMAVCFGKAPDKNRVRLENIEIRYLGTIGDENELAEWYNIADVFVAPSLQEGFGYTVCEALACGTPVTAFAIGGMLDQIVHKENGYLARLYDEKDLAEGIIFCAENKKQLGSVASQQIIEKNGYHVIGQKYHQLCRKVNREGCL